MDEYLEEGMLTTFSGVPFGRETPYTYMAAKRILGLLRSEICKDRRLKKLGASLNTAGRTAITGREATSVWDFIPLLHAKNASTFTQYPHLTIGIKDSLAEAYVTIPNGIQTRLRRNLLGENAEHFRASLIRVLDRLKPIIRSTGGVPTCVLVQRHYVTQRSRGIEDCLLRFDLRTALPKGSAHMGRVKSQPEWLETCYLTLDRRRSNLQFQIGMAFPYASCKVVGTSQIAKVFADTYIACQPIIRAALDGK